MRVWRSNGFSFCPDLRTLQFDSAPSKSSYAFAPLSGVSVTASA